MSPVGQQHRVYASWKPGSFSPVTVAAHSRRFSGGAAEKPATGFSRRLLGRFAPRPPTSPSAADRLRPSSDKWTFCSLPYRLLKGLSEGIHAAAEQGANAGSQFVTLLEAPGGQEQCAGLFSRGLLHLVLIVSPLRSLFRHFPPPLSVSIRGILISPIPGVSLYVPSVYLGSIYRKSKIFFSSPLPPHPPKPILPTRGQCHPQ